MAKRFHDTEIWEQDWFLEIGIEYRLLWFWIKDKCDHSGIWKPNKKMFEVMNGVSVDLNIALNLYNQNKDRIVVTKKHNWLLVDFFSFQYGTSFNTNNRLHESVYKAYYQDDIDLTTIRGLKEVTLKSKIPPNEDTEGVKDKDKEIKIKEGAETIKSSFEQFWNLYEKKIGKPKSLREWQKLTDVERILIFKYIPLYKQNKEPQFRKDPERFLKHKCWNDELVSTQSKTNGEVKHTEYVVKPSDFYNWDK